MSYILTLLLLLLHKSSAYLFAISTKSSTHLFGIKSNKLASILPPPSGTFTAFKISVMSASEHVFPFLSIVAVTTFANPVCTDPCGFMSFKNKCHPFKSTYSLDRYLARVPKCQKTTLRRGNRRRRRRTRQNLSPDCSHFGR